MSAKRHPQIGDSQWRYLVSRFRKGLRKLESGCWICDEAEDMGNGYGRLTVNRKPLGRYRILVHRLSYLLYCGPIPRGLCVCHSCDHPACCNPGHLFLGTHADNATDREAKGRGMFGIKHPNAKLTEEQVDEIRREAAAGTIQREIAQRHGLTQAAVSSIVTGKLWRHTASAPNGNERPRTVRKKVPCSVKGCRNWCRTHGMCLTHYRRLVATGSTDAPVAADAHESLTNILREKFVAHLQPLPSGCWECAASDYGHESGYGRVGIVRAGRGELRAFTHRLSYEHFRGQIPKDRVVCHSCDNRRCCNPDHLFLGTQEENLRDMVRKGRSRSGERHHNARLSEADIRAIKQMPKSISQRAIAAMYGISQPTVSDIVNGRRWKHLHQAAQD